MSIACDMTGEGRQKVREHVVMPTVRLKSAFVSRQAEEEKREAHATVAGSVLRRRTFYFQQRTGRLDLRRINRVDVERLVEEVDVDVLQQHLEDIAFSNLDEDDLRVHSDECFLKLFRLSQLTVEYLLSVQDALADSLESLASRHTSLQASQAEIRERLQAYADTERQLRREVRQKRKTIAKFEQLLSLPGGAVAQPDSSHACLSCGKLFSSDEYLQSHVARKHGNSKRREEEAPAVPAPAHSQLQTSDRSKSSPDQLHLYVQASNGTCLEVAVSTLATVSRVKDHIMNSGINCTLRHRLLFRGVAIQDDMTLQEIGVPNRSELLLLPPEEAEADAAAPSNPQEARMAEHMTALVGLVQQLLQNSQVHRDGEARALEMATADALEHRIKEMTVSMPATIAAAVEDGLLDVKDAMHNVMQEIDAHRRRSAAGAMSNDDEGLHSSQNRPHGAASSESTVLRSRIDELNYAVQRLSKSQHNIVVSEHHSGLPTRSPPPIHERRHRDRAIAASNGQWMLEFEAEGRRPRVAVLVDLHMTVEDVSTDIAEQLDIEEPRVALTVISTGAVVPPAKPASLLRPYWESANLALCIVEGHVLPDSYVDDIMEVYEKSVPAVSRSSSSFKATLDRVEARVLSPTRRRSLAEGLEQMPEQGTLSHLDKDLRSPSIHESSRSIERPRQELNERTLERPRLLQQRMNQISRQVEDELPGDSSYDETGYSYGEMDWEKTAETNVSIPEDALDRADHYEMAYASR